jgi:hypothetical protein
MNDPALPKAKTNGAPVPRSGAKGESAEKNLKRAFPV